MALQPLWTLAAFFSLLIYTKSVEPLGRGSACRKTATCISMPRMGFESKTPVLEGAKTVHGLDHAATVVGSHITTYTNIV
jgi:hypothetical protein